MATNKDYTKNRHSNPFNQPWANPKHAHAQVNGQTQQTQDTIILEKQTRKRS
ncbi:YpzG family protein [Bacillus carboniphilus]|uniref:YpzG family protein n=1 Tax=Bacillus carboniphilus TaxID=86663 RepID=A0ABY9JTJ8_9BACI|nr:YpzG family protein [Bacillus carboniphilus]WLR42672.1 YpzG family protein [Bacillus carboniphilus]